MNTAYDRIMNDDGADLLIGGDAPSEEAMLTLREYGADAYRAHLAGTIGLSAGHHVAGTPYRYKHGWLKIDEPTFHYTPAASDHSVHTLEMHSAGGKVGSFSWHGEDGDIVMIDTNPDMRHRGVATALRSKAETLSAEKGIHPPSGSVFYTPDGAGNRKAFEERGPADVSAIPTVQHWAGVSDDVKDLVDHFIRDHDQGADYVKSLTPAELEEWHTKLVRFEPDQWDEYQASLKAGPVLLARHVASEKGVAYYHLPLGTPLGGKDHRGLPKHGKKTRQIIGDTEVESRMRNDGHLEVTDLNTRQLGRGQGSARAAIRAVNAAADRAGVHTLLVPSPQDRSTKPRRLEGFYRSMGYQPNKGATRNRALGVGDHFYHRPPATPEPDLLGAIQEHGGFTYDPKLHKLLGVGDGTTQGFAVAVPHTETLLGGKDMTKGQFQDAIVKLVRDHPQLFEKGNTNIGGWFSDDRGQYMVEASELHDIPREDAVKLGTQRNQEAILDMATGEFISTGGTGG